MTVDTLCRGTGRIARWLGALLCVAGMAAHAAPVTIMSEPTNLTSTVDRMISYREQSHMWQTSDGATHLMLNRGPTTGGALSLNSSFDGGATWTEGVATLAATGNASTSDGYLDNDDLYVTYSGQANDIRFAHLRYNVSTKKWAIISTQMVYSNSSAVALSPAMAEDAMGRRWLAFTNQDIATSNYSIKMMRQDAGANTWVDTGFTFGPVDNKSDERSGRPIVTATGMGLIYTVHQNIYWASRNNAWAPTSMWQRMQTYVYANRWTDKDPYGSHYNAVVDNQNNIHLVSVDGGRLVYSRFVSATQKWDAGRVLTDDMKATYVQAIISMNNLVVVSNSNSILKVYQSSDGGNSFTNTHTLVHPTAVGQITYDNPREEAPGHSSTPIPLVQQYLDGSTQRALFFAIPVVTVPSK